MADDTADDPTTTPAPATAAADPVEVATAVDCATIIAQLQARIRAELDGSATDDYPPRPVIPWSRASKGLDC